SLPKILVDGPGIEPGSAGCTLAFTCVDNLCRPKRNPPPRAAPLRGAAGEVVNEAGEDLHLATVRGPVSPPKRLLFRHRLAVRDPPNPIPAARSSGQTFDLLPGLKSRDSPVQSAMFAVHPASQRQPPPHARPGPFGFFGACAVPPAPRAPA